MITTMRNRLISRGTMYELNKETGGENRPFFADVQCAPLRHESALSFLFVGATTGRPLSKSANAYLTAHTDKFSIRR